MIDLLMNDTPNVNYYLKDNYMMVKVYNQFYIGENIQNDRVTLVINDFGEYIISDSKKYIFSKIKLNITCTDYFELCYNKTVFPLYLRSRQDGDKMSLKVGTKKVKDILIDQKVEKLIRDDLILLADNDKVLWIPNIKKSIQNCLCNEKIYIYEVI
jgi:tRNA(Ile)-lysidine synthetase-like protein